MPVSFASSVDLNSIVYTMSSARNFILSSILLVIIIAQCYGDDGKFKPIVQPTNCIGKTICGADDVMNYPSEHIKELLQRMPPSLVHLLADDEDIHKEPPSEFSDLERRRRSAEIAERWKFVLPNL